MLNYVLQLNLFENLCTGILPPKAQLIYYKLFKWSNRFGLGEPFRLSNSVLMIEAGITKEKTLIDNRNLLKQYGFIDFEPGKKGSPSKYVLLDLQKYTYHLPVNTEVKTTVKTEVNTAVNQQVNNESLQSNNLLNINLKQNSKEKNTKKESTDEKTGFADFWEEYPKKKSKGDARKAFEKAIKKVSLQTILNAVRKHKSGAQWMKDNGQYIPYPATWLNREQWEDEPDFTPADNSQKPAYNPHARNDGRAGYQGAMKILEELIDDEETGNGTENTDYNETVDVV